MNGDLDVISGGQLYLGDGTGALLDQGSFAIGEFGAVVAGDFDGDGAVDVVAAEGSRDRVVLFLGDGTGGFSDAGSTPVGNSPADLEAADFDRDGALDVATANSVSSDLSVLLGDGVGGFTAQPIVPVPTEGALFPVAVDLDGNGIVDMAANGGRCRCSPATGTAASCPTLSSA